MDFSARNKKVAQHWHRKAESRFWSKVSKSPNCWTWTGKCNRQNGKQKYGTMRFKGHRVAAHRLSYELHFGPIPSGLFVCHHCDNTACVRPDHLFLGTCHDNVTDMIKKGRRAKMEHHTEESKRKIRESKLFAPRNERGMFIRA